MAETKCRGLTTTPIPHPLVLNGEDEIEELGRKLTLGRREEWREALPIYHYSTLLLAIYLPQVESVLAMTVTVEQCPCSYFKP